MKYFLPIICLTFLLQSCGEDQPKSQKSTVLGSERRQTTTEDKDPNKGNPADTIEAEDMATYYEEKRQEIDRTVDQALEDRTEEPVRISGYILNGAGKSITLDRLGGTERFVPLSTTIINDDNYFELETTTKEKRIFELRTDNGNIVMLIDGGDYEVEADYNNLNDYKINNPESYKLRDFFLMIEGFNQRVAFHDKRIQEEKRAWKLNQILDSLPLYNREINEDKTAALKTFIEQNRNSLLAAIAANKLDFFNNTAFVKEVYDDLKERYPYSTYTKIIGRKLVRYLPLMRGEEAPEIVMPDLSGKNYRLSDYEGQTVVLLFTLGFDKRCKQYALRLNSLYQRYQAANFEVFNICIDDQEDNVKSYIRETGVEWPVVTDLMSNNSIVFDHYLAEDFPMTYIIDEEGVIREKDLTVDEIEAYLKENL